MNIIIRNPTATYFVTNGFHSEKCNRYIGVCQSDFQLSFKCSQYAHLRLPFHITHASLHINQNNLLARRQRNSMKFRQKMPHFQLPAASCSISEDKTIPLTGFDFSRANPAICNAICWFLPLTRLQSLVACLAASQHSCANRNANASHLTNFAAVCRSSSAWQTEADQNWHTSLTFCPAASYFN